MTHTRSRIVAAALTGLVLSLAGTSHAQEPATVADASTSIQPADQNTDGAPAPAPGDEVMKPTRNGVQFTPNLARAFALTWLKARYDSGPKLSQDQTTRFSKALADRMLQLSQENAVPTQLFVEGLIETVMGKDGKVSPDAARKLAERTQPMLPLWRKFLDGMREDGSSILDDEQQKELEKVVQKEHNRLDRFEAARQRWAKGEFQEDDVDKAFSDRPEPVKEKEKKPPEPPMTKEQQKMARQAQEARRRAKWEMFTLDIERWQQFVLMVKSTFKYTPEQSTQADQLLAEYRDKAKAIMTTDWKRIVRDNRIKSQLRENMGKEPAAPWLFHLDREYERLVEPVKSMKKELYSKVLGLATDEQRAAVLDDLAMKAERHGVGMTEADRAVLLGTLK